MYEAAIARQRAKYGPAESTLQAAEFLLQTGDVKPFEKWLLAHFEDERAGIVKHLDRKAKR
jgi:hypothetical protein